MNRIDLSMICRLVCDVKSTTAREADLKRIRKAKPKVDPTHVLNHVFGYANQGAR
jgi:hypothetical protein